MYSEAALKDDNTTIEVTNVARPALPSTGGRGTMLFTVLGTVLTAGAGVLLWKRREMI